MCVSLINIKTDNEIKTPSQTIWKYIDSSQQKQAATVGQGEATHIEGERERERKPKPVVEVELGRVRTAV